MLMKELKTRLKRKLKDNFVRVFKKNHRAGKLSISVAAWRRKTEKK